MSLSVVLLLVFAAGLLVAAVFFHGETRRLFALNMRLQEELVEAERVKEQLRADVAARQGQINALSESLFQVRGLPSPFREMGPVQISISGRKRAEDLSRELEAASRRKARAKSDA